MKFAFPILICLAATPVFAKSLVCTGDLDSKEFKETVALSGERSSGMIVKKIGTFDLLAIARDSQVDLVRVAMGKGELWSQGGDGTLSANLSGSSRSSDGKKITIECSVK